MLELLISLRPQGETDLKKKGDVIAAAPKGFAWGRRERDPRQFLIVEHEDTELESRLPREGVLALPFHEHGKPLRSARRMNLTKLGSKRDKAAAKAALEVVA